MANVKHTTNDGEILTTSCKRLSTALRRFSAFLKEYDSYYNEMLTELNAENSTATRDTCDTETVTITLTNDTDSYTLTIKHNAKTPDVPESEMAEQTESAEQTETSEQTEAELEALNELDTDSRMSEIRDALKVLDNGTTFYQVSESDGILKGVNKITKNGEDSYTVNGVERCTTEVIRRIRDGSKEFTSSQPDVSSHVKITGTTTHTIDGLKFKDGVFDIIQCRSLYGKEGCRKVRKVERAGKITTYNGVQYGVNKNSGEYFTTHISTGKCIGRGQKNMKGVTSQIKETSERLLNIDLRKEIESFNNMIRGDIMANVKTSETSEQTEAEQTSEQTEAETTVQKTPSVMKNDINKKFGVNCVHHDTDSIMCDNTKQIVNTHKEYIVRAFENGKEITVQCLYFSKREYAIDYINKLCENGVVSRDVVFTINNRDIYDCFSDVKMTGTTAQIKLATDTLNEHYKRLCNDVALEYKMRIADDIDVENKDYYANLNIYVATLKKVLNDFSTKFVLAVVLTCLDKFEIWGNIYRTAMIFILSYNVNKPDVVIKRLENKIRNELLE